MRLRTTHTKEIPVTVPILHVDATVRPGSRTDALARWLLGRMGGPVETVRLADGAAAPLDGPALRRRESLLAEGRFDDPEFALARRFAAAERIVVAAPYWDLLFPASLRAYFERVCVVGVTFAWDEATGSPVSLCRARSLAYVCTAGGPVPRNLGFEYVEALCRTFFSIPSVRLLQAEGLDLPGADVPSLLARAQAAWTS